MAGSELLEVNSWQHAVSIYCTASAGTDKFEFHWASSFSFLLLGR